MNARTAQTAALALLAALLLPACAAKSGLESPVRDVGGTPYFTVTGRAPETGSFDFSRKIAWLSAASELSRARSTEVYARLTQEQRADLNSLWRRAGDRAMREIEGTLEFIDEATSSAPLRNVHELQVRREDGELILTLGIPMDTWDELVDEAAREVVQLLRGRAVDLEAPRRRLP